MSVSQNGWSVITRTIGHEIAGVTIPLRPGAAGRVLAEFARAFHQRVERLKDVRDDWGYSYRKIGGSSSWSNHASGTALDLNSLRHAQGRRGTFSSTELANLRRLLKEYPVIKWGGDYNSTPDEMHFEIGVSRESLLRWLRSRK